MGYLPFCGFQSARTLDPMTLLKFKKGVKFYYSNGRYNDYFIFDPTEINFKDYLICKISPSDFKAYFLTEDEMRDRKIEEVLE